MKNYKITPLDTLFFRGGQPFNQGETGQMEIEGSFPPSPTSVIGSLRVALARNLGWNGKGRWETAITDILGDGDRLSSLNFSGPYLLQEDTLVFPVPLHVLGKIKIAEDGNSIEQGVFTRLKPGTSLGTDIGTVQLPEVIRKYEGGEEVGGFKTLDSYWLTSEGMKSVLEGQAPNLSHIIMQKHLWQTENRVGIQRDYMSKTTKDNALYQTAHIRLAKNVSLAMTLDGLRNNIDPRSPAPLGGESRLAWIDSLTLPVFPKIDTLQTEDDTSYYVATLITPAKLTGDSWRKPSGEIKELPGKVMSACVGKPLLIGGWDSLARQPKELQPYLPPGSTFFMKAENASVEEILNFNGTHIGDDTNWGYGQILIGRWY